MSLNIHNQEMMQRALDLAHAHAHVPDPNPHVGCVIVKDGVIVGQGATQAVGHAHAEVMALQEAGDQAKGATMYVSLEPCAHHGRTPPCADALVKAQIAEVFIATLDPNPLVSGKSVNRLKFENIKTHVGLLEDQAKEINKGFFKRIKSDMPYVVAKIASSVDGRSALDDGASQWITNQESRNDVHVLRSKMSAIVTTASTVIADNPRMTARISEKELYDRQPLRVVLDIEARIPPDKRVFSRYGQCLLVVAKKLLHNTRERFSRRENVEVISVEDTNQRFNLNALMKELAKREINNVLIEAGGNFQGDCINAGIVDELWVYIGNHLMGQSKYGVIDLPNINDMQDRCSLELIDVMQFQNDVRLRYRL